MNKNERKKTGEDLYGFLNFRKRGYWVKSKKGKGSYDRARFNDEEEWEDYADNEDMPEV